MDAKDSRPVPKHKQQVESDYYTDESDTNSGKSKRKKKKKALVNLQCVDDGDEKMYKQRLRYKLINNIFLFDILNK